MVRGIWKMSLSIFSLPGGITYHKLGIVKLSSRKKELPLVLALVVEADTLQEGVGSGMTTSGAVETLVVAGAMGGMSPEIRVSIQDVQGVQLDAMERLISGLIRMEVEDWAPRWDGVELSFFLKLSK
ncbi:hypothetical protein CK203_031709 [Vitis vinifera]|uniref:Uncharacterized protein n=1 Tax=Vitis vinifera TaxID=29760 RepID=A0A438I3G9_VITVI|nr:hypothetical protein CK203_031709 [Vitis vinifera]